MTQPIGEKKARKPGSGRRPFLAASLAGVDAAKLRVLIDQHNGVILSMIEDPTGLAACGLVGDRPLSRVTLTTRLAVIDGFRDSTGRSLNALAYANNVRVRRGRPGPRRTPEAKRTAEEIEDWRRRLVDALARTRTKEEAAKMLGLATRRSLNKIASELNVAEEDVTKRRLEIATCAGCRTDGGQKHTCGAQP